MIEGALSNRHIILEPRNIFHFSRPGTTGEQTGWGTPIILPVLKDLFQIQIVKKAR